MRVDHPVFVVGVGRSGTSLVQSMLAAHPHLVFLPETGFIRRYLAKNVITRLARRHGAESVVERLVADKRFQRLEISPDELVAVTTRDGPLTDANLYRSLLGHYLRIHGGERPGDKDPRLVEHLPLLHRLFPKAWVVHVIRDPRDVLASKKSAVWSRDHHYLRHVFASRVQLRMGRREGRRRFEDRYVEFFYEDVLQDPIKASRSLCEDLKILYSSAMLEYADEAARLVSSEELAWKSETLGPILRDNRGKWRGRLSPRETIVTEKACRDGMLAGAYSPAELKGALDLVDRAVGVFMPLALAAMDPIYRFARRLRDAVVRVDGFPCG